ncbi:MAG: energy transducer TonB, partial [Luteibacter sp.]
AVMRPMVAEISLVPAVAQTIRLIDHPPEPKPIPPPPIDLKPLPVRQPRTITTVPKPVEQPPQVQAATPTDEGTAPPVPPAPVQVAPVAPPAVPAGPVEATLAYVSAPAPVYPRVAIGARMAGTVTLRVLVDEDGKPIDVVIESSSGHAVLDKAARDQVLAKWRFQPAQQNGQKVKAWARIPVSFDLRNI